MPSQTIAVAFRAVKQFRQKELRAPRIRVLKPYRAPIPKPLPSAGNTNFTEADAQPKPHGQPNPFLPRFNTKTNRWAPPKYSLRQQAELIKKAKLSNTVHLLPPGPKFDALDIRQHVQNVQSTPPTVIRRQRWAQINAVVWEGQPKPKVIGADIGNRLYAGKKRMFKGHKRERTRVKRETRRSILLRGMKKRILRYKGVSVVFSLFLHFFFACSLVCADLLVSIIIGGGHIRSNLRRLPSPQSYPSRSRSLGARTSCFTLANIIYTLSMHQRI
jgi:large subunit ribosomal protein L25